MLAESVSAQGARERRDQSRLECAGRPGGATAGTPGALPLGLKLTPRPLGTEVLCPVWASRCLRVVGETKQTTTIKTKFLNIIKLSWNLKQKVKIDIRLCL